MHALEPDHAFPRSAVILVAARGSDHDALENSLHEAGVAVTRAPHLSGVLEAIHDRTPQAILVPAIEDFPTAAQIVRELKADHAYGHLPVMLILSNKQVSAMAWDEVPGDDFVVWPAPPGDLASRLRLCHERAMRDLDANPLTGLPGNLTIMHEADRRIAAGTHFALGYIDLDNFKAYNDKYGFSRGDEVLRMTARVVVNAVRMAHNSETYVGHIGGDDFVTMLPSDLVESVCGQICRDFDQIIPNFYDPDDRRAGMIQSVDRQGAERSFPLIACSIAVVDTGSSHIAHLGELSARAAELKKLVKATDGSCYLIDRRK